MSRTPMLRRSAVVAAGAIALCAFLVACSGHTGKVKRITGAGSSFAYPLYSAWADRYHRDTGVEVNYQSIGSGGGIRQIEARTVHFGATDAPLTAEELEKEGLVQFPAAMGSVVPVVNIPGIRPGELVLSGPLLAAIYLGKIVRWDAPAIRRLNPRLALPPRRITVVYRSDGSGTTFIFTNYLAKVNAAWKTRVGFGKAVAWPLGIGGKGNEGVAAYVQHIPGAIGYVEYAFARQSHITFTDMVNHAGRRVAPNAKDFAAAAAHADWAHAPGFYLMLTDQLGAESWPLVGATFVLVPARPRSAPRARAVLDFFDWAYRNGGTLARRLDYIPMPPTAVREIERRWHERIRAGGQPVWPGSAGSGGTAAQDKAL